MLKCKPSVTPLSTSEKLSKFEGDLLNSSDVNTKNWYREETDLWAEFGGKSTIRQEVFFKAFGKGICGQEYVIIRQKSGFTLGGGSIRECVMTWLEYKEGTN
jgi:hypothetical protein